MTRNKTLAAIGTALAIASTAALAQNAGPDFSPMKPDTYTTEAPPPQADAPVRTDNRMLDAYETSNALPNEPAAPPVAAEPPIATQAYTETYVTSTPAPRHRVEIEPPTPRQSTIGNGLFDRRGPNDFGA